MAKRRLRATLVLLGGTSGPRAKINVTAKCAKGFDADVIVFHRRPRKNDYDDMTDYSSFMVSLSHAVSPRVVYGSRTF